MTIKASELRRGQALIYDGKLQVVIGTDHVKPGKGPAYVQAKMKAVDTGTIKVNRFNTADKVEAVNIDRRPMQFLFENSGQGLGPWVFMDNESYEQLEIGSDVIEKDQSQWLKDGLEVLILMYESRALGVELPAAVELEITETNRPAKSCDCYESVEGSNCGDGSTCTRSSIY